jgi:hypothetical protein
MYGTAMRKIGVRERNGRVRLNGETFNAFV